MASELGVDVIKSTQNSLGKYVKRPPLTEKLLKKPPFRFLHDVIMAVMKNTGFFEGLFTEDELNSENVNDRDKKIAFLQKIIQVMDIVTESTLTVRPSKIVAGHEPDKTNELLQKIGEALSKKLSSDAAVETIVGVKPNKKQKEEKPPIKTKTEPKKIAELKTKEKIDDKKTKVKLVNKIETKSRESNKKTENRPKKPKQTKETIKPTNGTKKNHNGTSDSNRSAEETSSVISKNESVIINNDIGNNEQISLEIEPIKENESNLIIDDEPNQPVHENGLISTPTDTINANPIENDVKTKPEIEPVIVPSQKTSNSAKNHRNNSNEVKKTSAESKVVKNVPPPIIEKSDEPVVRPRTSVQRPIVRPSSSRPGAPRFKDPNVDVISTNELIIKGKVNIIAENYDKQPDGDDGSVVMDNSTFDIPTIDNDMNKIPMDSNTSNHGHLVQQILETQKELDGDAAKVEIEWEWTAKRERETSFKEIESLQNNLQTLSRVANPLGKLMDYIQEDVETMRQELAFWRHARNNTTDVISQQENQIEKSIKPLEAKLKQLENSIIDQLEQIHTVKASILRNNNKIKKIISGE